MLVPLGLFLYEKVTPMKTSGGMLCGSSRLTGTVYNFLDSNFKLSFIINKSGSLLTKREEPLDVFEG